MASLFSAVNLASAQEGFFGRGRYPQFRNMSGLPGGTFGVRPDGRPGISGAMAISTPIGYSLTDWRFVVAAANMSNDSRPRFFDTSEGDQGAVVSNGTGAIMVGLPLGKYGRGTVSRMIISSDLDYVYNLQYQFPLADERIGVSIGAQDILSDGGAAGEFEEGDKDISRSVYAVGTYDFGHGVYGSLGLGNRRFRGGFANVSVPLGQRARATAEYDGYGINFGASYSLGHFPERRRFEANLFFGYIRGRNATLGLNVSF